MRIRKLLCLIVGFAASGFVVVLLLLNAGILKERSTVDSVAMPRSGRETLQFPLIIPNTNILVVRMATYEGPDIEQMRERMLLDAAALELINVGDTLIEKAQILLCGNDAQWKFPLTYLPPGERILVIEESGRPCNADAFDSISAVTEDEEDEMILSRLEITDIGIGRTRLTNIGSDDMTNLRIIYKNYTQNRKMLVGGISFSYTVESLRAGESVELNLPNYAMGFSKIVSAKE